MAHPTYVTAGGLRIDYLITRAGEAVSGLPGGNALYAAAGAAYWTPSVALWARYGRSYPQQWLTELQRYGLDTQGLVPVTGDHDHRTFFAYRPDGQRDDTNPAAHYARINQPLPGALTGYVDSTPMQSDPHHYEPLAPRPSDWPDSFKGVTAVHLSPLPLATHYHVAHALSHKPGRQISVDPGERYMIPTRISYIRQILSFIDVFLPSDQEVRSLLGAAVDLRQAAKTFVAWGVPLVVIKMGKQGVLLHGQRYEQPLQLPPYHTPGDARVIDVTGAGDAFCGGFMVGLARTADPIHAVQMGLVSASLVIEGYGALYALEVDKKRAENRLEALQSREDR